jgi:HEAT repeat protein
MSHIRRNFNLLEWAIYLAERETLMRRRAAESAEQAANADPETFTPADLAIDRLVSKINSPDQRVRHEVARALGEIGDPSAAAALVSMLVDEDHSVRWAAMGSLINMNREAVRPLLEALTRNFQSARLREGVHHVLRALHSQGMLNGVEDQVFHALEGAAPGIQAAWAANNALIGYQASPGD